MYLCICTYSSLGKARLFWIGEIADFTRGGEGGYTCSSYIHHEGIQACRLPHCSPFFPPLLPHHSTRLFTSLPQSCLSYFPSLLPHHYIRFFSSLPHMSIPCFVPLLPYHSLHFLPSLPHSCLSYFPPLLPYHSTHFFPSFPHLRLPIFPTGLSITVFPRLLHIFVTFARFRTVLLLYITLPFLFPLF